MANLIPILDDNQIALEKQSLNTFGAAVDDFKRGTLKPATSNAPVVASNAAQANSRGDGSFYSSSYAAALAGGTSYRPKLKFLFKVEFVFTPEAIAEFPDIFRGDTAQDFTFMVKSVDRPKIDFEYEDDVNMYNFRTKVLKKIRHRELTITFMDDTGNRVLNFFRGLMMIHSPITRRQLLREQLSPEARLSPPDSRSISQASGMEFTNGPTPSLADSAIRGTFNSDVGNIISTIRVKQMYVDSGASLGDASKEVIFDFLNARLVSFDLDDLSHEASDPNIMTMQFDYDWMEIIHSGSLTKQDTPVYNISVPGVNGAPSDTTPSGRQGSAQGGNHSTYINEVPSLGTSTEAFSRSVTTTPGGGIYNNSMLSGVVGAGQRSLSTGLSTPVVNQAGANYTDANIITAPPRPMNSVVSVFDSTEGGPSPTESVVTAEPAWHKDVILR